LFCLLSSTATNTAAAVAVLAVAAVVASRIISRLHLWSEKSMQTLRALPVE
jgi:hypothetical protein